MKNSLRALALLALSAVAPACGGALQPGLPHPETGVLVHGDPAVFTPQPRPELPEPESPAQELMKLLLSSPEPVAGFDVRPVGSSPEPVPGYWATPKAIAPLKE